MARGPGSSPARSNSKKARPGPGRNNLARAQPYSNVRDEAQTRVDQNLTNLYIQVYKKYSKKSDWNFKYLMLLEIVITFGKILISKINAIPRLFPVLSFAWLALSQWQQGGGISTQWRCRSSLHEGRLGRVLQWVIYTEVRQRHGRAEDGRPTWPSFVYCSG